MTARSDPVSTSGGPADIGGEAVIPVTTSRSPFLTVPDVASRLRCSVRSVHDLTRFRRIPHRKLPGGRRILFLQAELDAWVDGAALEVVDRPEGGRIVRPVVSPESPPARRTAS